MDIDEWLNIFGDNLRDVLIDQQMTQRELADATGLAESTISSYLRKQKVPSVKALINISIVLNISLDDLMNFDSRII